MAGPLSHVRVLDLSRVLAGPWSTQMLADMGAEVLKVERPGEGDDTRGWGPPFITNADGTQGDAAYFLCANRGKKSVAVDFTTPAGREAILALAETCDILVENYKVGGLEKYGLAYDAVKARNPGIIYCSITGFGQTGPYAARPGYDFLIQGMGGLMSVTGEPDGVAGGGPQKAGVAVADLFTGLYATIGILGALAHRERTGEGQQIDIALLDAQVAVMANQNMNYLVSGQAPGRLGNAHPNIVPYQAFRTADGHLILAVGNDGQFGRFMAAAGRPDLVTDARFRSNRERVENRAALVPLVAEIMRTRTTDQWIAILEAANVPCGPVNSIDRVFADPQVQSRGLLLALERADGVRVPSVASPIKYSATPLEYRTAPPRLGEHTEAVLKTKS